MTNKFVASIMLSMSLVACGGGSGGTNASEPAASATQKPKVQIDFGASILPLAVGSYPSESCVRNQYTSTETSGPGVIIIGSDLTLKTSEINETMLTLNKSVVFNKKLDGTGFMNATLEYKGDAGLGLKFSIKDSSGSIIVGATDFNKTQSCYSYSSTIAGLNTKSAYQAVAKFLDVPKATLLCPSGLLSYQLKEGIATLGDKTIFNLNADLTEESVSVLKDRDGMLAYDATASDGVKYSHQLDKYGDLYLLMIQRSPSDVFSCVLNK